MQPVVIPLRVNIASIVVGFAIIIAMDIWGGRRDRRRNWNGA